LKAYRRIIDIQADLLAGNTTCEQLVMHYLDQIKEKQHLNAFLEVWGEEALEKAKDIDRKIASGIHGKLAGAVIALKDNMSFKGHKVSASSKILEGFEALYTATAIERLAAEDFYWSYQLRRICNGCL